MNKYYKLLILFSEDTQNTRKRLLKIIPPDILDEALSKKYIVQCGTTDIGDALYSITALGKKVRDE